MIYLLFPQLSLLQLIYEESSIEDLILKAVIFRSEGYRGDWIMRVLPLSMDKFIDEFIAQWTYSVVLNWISWSLGVWLWRIYLIFGPFLHSSFPTHSVFLCWHEMRSFPPPQLAAWCFKPYHRCYKQYCQMIVDWNL